MPRPLLVLALCSLASTALAAPPAARAPRPLASRLARPLERAADQVVLIRRLESGARAAPAAALERRLAALGLRRERIAATSTRGGFVVEVLSSPAAGFDPVAASGALRGEPGVLAASPNYRFRLFDTLPNDPMRPLQWYVDNGDSADVELPGAWDIARADSATLIAILDTGIDLGHPDLSSKLWTNPGEIPGNLVDDDANGFVDDVHGWDFGDGDADPNPGPTIDPIGLDVGFHGTFCAGIAAAATANGAGISGAGWNARLVALKVSNAAGEITSDALAGAFAYATDLGVAVANLSLGGPGDPGVPEFFQALVDAADAAGVLVVAAAGNDGVDTPSYPAANDRVLAVAATDFTRARAEFSNWGSWVDLAAPGSTMWSSIARNYVVDDISQIFYILFFGWDGIEPYMYGDGTSFACPLTAGVAALLRAERPGLTPQQALEHLVATGDPIAFDHPVGPKLNAWRAVSAPVLAAPAAAGAARARASVAPLPMRGAGLVRLALPGAGRWRLDVFDAAGRRVRTLLDRVSGPGPVEVRWDGRDDEARVLPDGVYLVRLAGDGGVATAKAVLLRR